MVMCLGLSNWWALFSHILCVQSLTCCTSVILFYPVKRGDSDTCYHDHFCSSPSTHAQANMNIVKSFRFFQLTSTQQHNAHLTRLWRIKHWVKASVSSLTMELTRLTAYWNAKSTYYSAIHHGVISWESVSRSGAVALPRALIKTQNGKWFSAGTYILSFGYAVSFIWSR